MLRSSSVLCYAVLSHFSCVQLFEAIWTIDYQAPLSMGFSWQEYWSGLLWHPPGDLPDSGIETVSLVSSIGGQALYHQHYLESSGLVQFSPVAQSCPTLCDPLDCSMPGFPVHHQLPGAYSNSYPLSW